MKPSRFVMVILTASILIFTLSSCFIFNISHSGAYTLEELRNGAYIGGSILLNPVDLNLSQLKPGMYVPFRIDEYDWVYDGEVQGDIEEHINTDYGYLRILEVLPQDLKIDIILFDESGKISINKHGTLLSQLENLDFNGDSRSDFKFENILSTGSPRTTDENSFFLTFHSQTVNGIPKNTRDGETSYYCSYRIEDPDNVSAGSSLPEDFVAVSLDKNFVFNDMNFKIATSTSFASPTQIAYVSDNFPLLKTGDIIYDNHYIQLREVLAVNEADGVTLIDTTPTTMDKIYGSVYVDVQGSVGDLRNRYSRNSPRWTKNLLNEKFKLNLYKLGDATADLELDTVMSIEIDAKIQISLTRCSCDVKVSLPSELTTLFKITIPAEVEIPLLDIELFDTPPIAFLIGGVPVSIHMPISLSVDTKVGGEIELDFGAKMEEEIGARLFGEIKLSWFQLKSKAEVTPIFNHKFSMVGPEINARIFAEAKAAIVFSPEVSIALIFSPKLDIPVYCKGEVTYGTDGGNFEVAVGAEADVGLEIGYKCLKKSWDFGQIFDWEHVIYEKHF